MKKIYVNISTPLKTCINEFIVKYKNITTLILNNAKHSLKIRLQKTLDANQSLLWIHFVITNNSEMTVIVK